MPLAPRDVFLVGMLIGALVWVSVMVMRVIPLRRRMVHHLACSRSREARVEIVMYFLCHTSCG